MAMTLKLVRLDDLIADVDSVDLTAGGYSLALNGYQPTAAADGDYSVTESITLNIQSTSADALATLVQALDAKIKQVGWWLSDPGVERYQVWLRVGLNGETNTRQAMILSIRPPDKLPLFNRLIDNNNLLASYTFAIERTPYWEDTYSYPTQESLSGLSPLGGAAALSATIYGDVPARLARVTVNDLYDKYSAWVGFKSNRLGNSANFVPNWMLSNFGILYYDTSIVGSNAEITFATTPTLDIRALCRLVDITANASDQRGKYTVLMLARMNDTSIARARIGFGGNVDPVANSANFRSRQVISGTYWRLYDMGTMTIPSTVVPYNYNFQYWQVRIDAERLSGTGVLMINRLILVPAESMVKIEASTQNYTNDAASIYQKADGSITCLGASDIQYSPHPIDWGLPSNDDKPLLVVCVDRVNQSTPPSGTLSVTIDYIPRWRTLRGNES